jgi:predicted metal-binding protein
MNDSDLEKHCARAIEGGVTSVKQINPNTVVTAPWVRMKCLYGCPMSGHSYCCPPDTPTPEQTQATIDCYKRALLFHVEAPDTKDRAEKFNEILEMLTTMEGEMFKDGFYKAFVLLAGPCPLCKECAKSTQEPCRFGDRARPSMEGAGIDVFQTARNNGFPIVPLKEVTETQNLYSLMLVD